MRHDTAPTINSEITMPPMAGVGGMDLADADRDSVAELADLDSRRAPDGPVLGAEVEGTLLAAISLTTGDVIADPFSRTADLRPLLETRAVQLRRRRSKPGLRLPRRSRPARRGTRSR